jgi:hypothetical protein
MKLKKGSKEAKAYMAKLRALAARRRKNPLTRAEAADTLRSARHDLAAMKSEATHHGRSFLAGRAVGKAWGAKMHGPDRDEHRGAEAIFKKGYKAGLSLKNPPRTQKGAERLLDKQIEAAYYRLCDRVQVSIMDIPKIFRDVKSELAAGTDMDSAILSVVKHYQIKGHGGRELPNPPAYFIIDQDTNKILAIVRGHPMKSFGESVTKGIQIAKRLKRAVIHVVNPYVPKGFGVGTQVSPLFYSYKSNLIHPDGSMSSRNPGGRRAARSNPARVVVIADLVQLEARKIAGWLRREGVPATEDPVRGAWGVMVPKALEAKAKIALGRVLTKNPPARCNPSVCRNPAHGHRPCKPNPLIQTVMLAGANPGKPCGLCRKPMVKLGRFSGGDQYYCKRCNRRETLRPSDAKIFCHACGTWSKSDGPFKKAPAGVGWMSGKPACRQCLSGMIALKREGYAFKNPPISRAWGKLTKRQRQELLELVGVDQDYSWLDAKLPWKMLDQRLKNAIESGWFNSTKRRRASAIANPLTRSESAAQLIQARYALSRAKKEKRGGVLRATECGEAAGRASVVQTLGPASARNAALKTQRRAFRMAYTNPAPKGAIEIPFRQGQIITVEQALAWARKTGNTSLVKQCQEAIKLCKRSNGPATKVRFDLVAMGDPKQIDTVMAGVEYGETDETVYKPTKGSKKGQHLYRHEWGEGSGKRKTVPLIATPGGKALVMPLRAGQKATDWLRG